MNELDVFVAALALADDAQRLAYLDQACAGQPELRRRLDELLATSRHGHSPLDRPALATVGLDLSPAESAIEQATTVEAPFARPDAVLAGKYKLIEPIGEGGMGTVWLAQQTEPIKRLVAIKLIKPGMDSRQVLARFEAERQALALMDHPNIAKVLDAGTTGTVASSQLSVVSKDHGHASPLTTDNLQQTTAGRPFFVMELVKGVPITKYCDDHRLAPRQRVELFVSVCHAIQHAHQKGIIHRDVKPSNVLVAQYDGRPVPKVIDFGVAKAAGPQLTDRTLVTGFGSIVGTLEYLSPEQAELNQIDVDTRSDVYALGVLLYELLTGTTPFDRKRLRKGALLEVLRIIREEDPPKPSTRLSDSKDTLPSISAKRQMEPARLTRLVRGELDWIVMKCLEKDRNQRYETANGLALDLQRYLADEPVQAARPSPGYRFRKFARRHRVTLTTAALVAFALVIGLAASTWQAVRAMQARALAEGNFRLALHAVNRYFDKVTQDPDLKARGDFHPLRAKLLREAPPFYQEFVKRRTNEPGMEAERGKAHGRLGQLLQELGEHENALANYDAMNGIFTRLVHATPTDPEFQNNLAQSHYSRGRLLGVLGRNDEAQAAYEESLKLDAKLVAEHPANLQYRRSRAITLHGLGVLHDALGRHEQAVAAYQDAIPALETIVRQFPNDPDHAEELADMQFGFALRLRQQQRSAEALPFCRQAQQAYLQLARHVPGVFAYRQKVAGGYTTLGNLLLDVGQRDQALESQQEGIRVSRALAADYPTLPEVRAALGRSCVNLAWLLGEMGMKNDALAANREALAIQEMLVADFPQVTNHALGLGASLCNMGHFFNDDHPEQALDWYGKAIYTLAGVLAKEPRLARAQQFLRNAHLGRAAALGKLARHAEAVPHWDKAISLEPESSRVAFRCQRAVALARAGDHAQAMAEVNALAELASTQAGSLYELATACAIASAAVANDPGLQEQYAARAVAILRQAIARGFRDVQAIKTSPAFAPLRERADFRGVIGEGEESRK